MTSSELIEKLSIQIYKHPLSEIRESNEIKNIDNPLSIVILIIDFDTEWQMNGIFNFLGNSTGRYVTETLTALQIIGATSTKSTLQKIADIASESKMTFDAIQADRSTLTNHEISSWNSLHGDKWHKACNMINELDRTFDFHEIYERLEAYVNTNFEELMNKTSS